MGMGFVESTYLILGMLLGVVGIAVVRWIILQPTRKALTNDLIEQVNGFNSQIRKLSERMSELTHSLEARRKNVLTGDDVEIADTMSEMNRLLHDINDFFDREEAEELKAHTSDFTGPDELEKFESMERITDDDLARADWDKLIDQLRDESEKK